MGVHERDSPCLCVSVVDFLVLYGRVIFSGFIN
jgi:hypothetical protein